jgi:hypothetical protein
MDFVLDDILNPVMPGETAYCLQTQYDFTFPAAWDISQHCHGLVLRSSRSDKSLHGRVGKFSATLDWFDEATV